MEYVDISVEKPLKPFIGTNRTDRQGRVVPPEWLLETLRNRGKRLVARDGDSLLEHLRKLWIWFLNT